jgi:hypothetical protein
MIFRKKNEDEDYSEIKDAINSEPDEDYVEMPKKTAYSQEFPARREEESAPLFVKVEKYREILNSMQEIKIFVSGMKQLFNILHDIETVREESLKIMRATIQRFERCVVEIDTELLRPKGADVGIVQRGTEEVKYIETSLAELQKTLSSLREELKDFR